MNSNIFPWKRLAIASTGIIILFVGGFLISGNQPVQSQQPTLAYKKAAANTLGGGMPVNVSTPATKIDPPVTAVKRRTHKKYAKKIVPNSADTSTNNASLSSNEVTPMDEMVVMGLAAQKEESKVIPNTPTEAHPKNGWNSFDSYLKEKAVSPDGKTGIVKLSFMVNEDGTFSGFRIRTGLSTATDQKAIELIKNGQAWTANPNGLVKESTVNVEFH